MKRVNMPTWIVTGLAIAAAGCSTAAPTVSSGTDAQKPNVLMAPDRTVLADEQLTNDDVLKALPKQISNADASKMLVDLPSEKLQGQLMQGNERSTQQWWGRGWRGFGWRGLGWGGYGGFRYFPYRSFYYPYYSYAGSYYPYSYPYYGSYYYPYYYGYGSYYRPYYWRYGYRWW